MIKESFEFKNKLIREGGRGEAFDHYICDLLASLILQLYAQISDPISELVVPVQFENVHEMEEVVQANLTRNLGEMEHPFRFRIHCPLRGQRKRLLELALANARLSFQELLRDREKRRYARDLKTLLKLKKIPRIIESFDIANTADRAIIAGMVRFVEGKPDKQNYRIFNIRSTATQNDFQSMQEAVHRRYKRLRDEQSSLPDLILIDGGKGQLTAAINGLNDLGIRGQPVISLAKREEEIYVPKKAEPLSVSAKDPALQFLIEIRDETHRFTNSRHIERRDKEELTSILNGIQGLGSKKIGILRKHFNSLEDVMLASKERIVGLPFFGEVDFERIKNFFIKKMKMKNAPGAWVSSDSQGKDDRRG